MTQLSSGMADVVNNIANGIEQSQQSYRHISIAMRKFQDETQAKHGQYIMLTT